MIPSKKKPLKPKEVSLDPSLKEETPIVELPNKMLGHLPFLTFHYPVKMRKKNSSPIMLGICFDVLFKLSPLYPEGKCLRKLVKYQDMETMEQCYQWNENEITIGEPHTSFLENSWDKSILEFLKTNSIQNLHVLWK